MDEVLDVIHFHQGMFSYIAHVKSGRYSHVSPSFSALTGYTIAELESEGVQFYMNRVPKEDVLKVIERQVEAFKEVTHSAFDPELPNFIQMQARFKKKDGTVVRGFGETMALCYSTTGEFEIVLVCVFLDSGSDELNDVSRTEIRALMTKVKNLYRGIYPQRPIKPVNELIKIVFEVDPRHILTPAEKRVLQRIASGLSTKQVASNLGISENTV